MKHAAPPTPAVVVYVTGSCPDHGTAGAGHSGGDWSEVKSAHLAHIERRSADRRERPAADARAYDPHRVRREFPERWQAYIRSHYRDYGHVMQVFQVCERTARKWMAGETGAVGGHVAVALLEHPREALQMLFAAE